MSTNFYMTKKVEACEHCGAEAYTKQVHLGKRAKGWKFSFKGDKENGVTDFNSWYSNVLKLSADGYKLENEYGMKLENVVDFMEMAEDWSKPEGKSHSEEYPSENDWLDRNGHSFSDHDFC